MSMPALTLGARLRAVALALALVVLGLLPGVASATGPTAFASATCVTGGNTTATWSHEKVQGVDFAWFDANGNSVGNGVDTAFSHPKLSGSIAFPTPVGAAYAQVTFVGVALAEPSCQ